MKDGSSVVVRRWVINQGSVVVVVTFLTVLLAIMLNKVQAQVGWLILLTSLAFILIVFGLITWLIVRYVFKVSIDLSDDIRATLDKYIGAEKISWLMTTPQLVRFESKARCSDIWLFSADVSTDCVGSAFQKVVSENLKRGIRYHYFVPDTPAVRARIEQLFRYNKNNPNLKVAYLDDSFFFLVPRFDFAIYNPYKEGDTPRVAYMGLPVPGEADQYHAEFSDELTDVLMGKIAPLVKE